MMTIASKSKNFRILTKYLLIFAILWFSFLQTANLHKHVLPDGRIVFHSHSYKETGVETESNGQSGHNHTNIEYLFYYFATELGLFLLFIVFIYIFVNTNAYTLFLEQLHTSQSSIYWYYLQRGPPSIPSYRNR